MQLEERLQAPVAEGQQVGWLIVRREGTEVCRIPVNAAEEIPRLTLLQIFRRLFFCVAGKKFMGNS